MFLFKGEICQGALVVLDVLHHKARPQQTCMEYSQFYHTIERSESMGCFSQSGNHLNERPTNQ